MEPGKTVGSNSKVGVYGMANQVFSFCGTLCIYDKSLSGVWKALPPEDL
jgi:hypothetical protein